MEKLNPTDIALLQARGLLNQAEGQSGPHDWQVNMYNAQTVKDMVADNDDVIIKIHGMCWGLFKSSLLKAMKGRDDLRVRNPELFADESICEKCKGGGAILHQPGSAAHDRLYEHFYFDVDDQLEDDAPPRTEPIRQHCSPCQATGILTKKDREHARNQAQSNLVSAVGSGSTDSSEDPPSNVEVRDSVGSSE